MPVNRTIAVLCLALVIAGCSDTGQPARSSPGSAVTTTIASDGSTTAPTTVPAAGAGSAAAPPTVGDCLEPMTAPLAAGNQLPEIVPCASAHGGEVVAVYQLPGGSDAAYPAAQRSIHGADDTVARCVGGPGELGEFGDFAGDNRIEVPSADRTATGVTDAWAVTGVEAALYVPGPARWSAGERWLVCAAVLDNSIEAPTAYDGSVRGARSRRGALDIAFAWCKNQPDARNVHDFQSVRCDRPHNFEQLSNFAAGTSDAAFPGEPALDQLAARLCGPLSSAATAGRSDHLDPAFGLSWTFPQEADWAKGERVVRCFAASRQGLTTGTVGSGEPATTR